MKQSQPLVAVVTKLKLVQHYAKTLLLMYVPLATLFTPVSKKWLILVVELINSVSVLQHVHLKSKSLLVKKFKKALLSVFFIGCSFSFSTLYADSSSAFSSNTHCPTLSKTERQTAQVAYVKYLPDGDTIHAQSYAQLKDKKAPIKKFRLLLIDTPEINYKKSSSKKYLKQQKLAQKAKQRLAEIIGNSGKFYWQTDQQRYDQYGRQLIYAFNQQGELINAKLIAEGLAQSLVIPPNDKYWQCIKQLELTALNAKNNLWNKKTSKLVKAKKTKPKKSYQLVKGKITQIKNTRKYQWLILDNTLWVGIKRKYLNQFEHIQFKTGKELMIRGKVYRSYGKNRISLKHPGMLYYQ